MNKAVIILSAIFLIFFVQFTSGQVQVSNFSINTQYSPNATITGFVNLSLSGISSNAYILSSFGQNISLKSLLNQQASTFNYSCSTSDCNSSYSVTDSGSPYENFSLSGGQSQVFGFLINGNAPSISAGNIFSLSVASDADMASIPQLSVDLLNDGLPEWMAYQPSGIVNQQNFGCYSDSLRNAQPSYLTSTPYCEKISIPISAQVNLGAQIIGSGNAQFQMTMQNINGSSAIGSCNVAASITQPGTQPISCVAKNPGGSTNYLVKSNGDYWVCIKQTSGVSNIYQINTANPANPCGFTGNFAGNYTIDFQIFGQSVLFSPVGTFIYNDTEIANSGYIVTSNNNLEKQIVQYLQNKYGDKCQNGCVVPISFYAAQDQNINLTNLNLLVTDNTYGTTAISSLYNVAQSVVTLSTKGYQSLSLNNGNFSVPNTPGNSTFTLTLYDGSSSYQLLTKTIGIAQIPKVTSVITSGGGTTTAAALPTNLTATINTYDSNSTISQYQWNFGDGSPTQTTINSSVSHTYSSIGVFNLQVTISNSQGLSSTGNFSISVIAPKDAVNQILGQDLQNVANIQSQISVYPNFTQSAINQLLNLDNVSTLLNNLQIKNNSASSDIDYVNIMKTLLPINLPSSIQQTSTASSIPFLPSGDTINLDALERVGGGTYDSTRKSDYVNSILAWDLNNISMTIDYSEFSGVYGASTVTLLDVVKLNFVGNSPTNKVYLFIPNLNGIYLDKSYQLTGSFYSVPLTGTTQTVQFATTQSYLPIQLPIFISPSLDQISIPKQAPETNTANNMLILGLILGGIAIVGIGAYVLIGRWYQRRYESFLFKDRNDLYNIINYVHTSKNKGLKEIDIQRNLSKSKWTSEQIDYVLKRYAGKKIGIPGFKKKK